MIYSLKPLRIDDTHLLNLIIKTYTYHHTFFHNISILKQSLTVSLLSSTSAADDDRIRSIVESSSLISPQASTDDDILNLQLQDNNTQRQHRENHHETDEVLTKVGFVNENLVPDAWYAKHFGTSAYYSGKKTTNRKSTRSIVFRQGSISKQTALKVV